ncbi:MAG: ABC transporter ATP-binding protein [Elusimicrobia bacterium]|nr:ABC transporter ATP-binding protein [Elusimicrobiota bacterium]
MLHRKIVASLLSFSLVFCSAQPGLAAPGVFKGAPNKGGARVSPIALSLAIPHPGLPEAGLADLMEGTAVTLGPGLPLSWHGTAGSARTLDAARNAGVKAAFSVSHAAALGSAAAYAVLSGIAWTIPSSKKMGASPVQDGALLSERYDAVARVRRASEAGDPPASASAPLNAAAPVRGPTLAKPHLQPSSRASQPRAVAAEPLLAGAGLETSALGQLGAGIVSAGLAAALYAAGVAVLPSYAILPAPSLADVFSYALLSTAAFGGAASLGFGVLGLRVALSTWREINGDAAASSRPLATRLWQALSAPVAWPEGPATEVYLNLSARTRDVINAHEEAHRQGHGELGAYFKQGLGHVEYLYGETRDAAIAAARGMWSILVGDPDVGHVVKHLRPAIYLYAFFFLLDSLLGIGISRLLKPILDMVSLGAAANTTLLAWHTGAIVFALLLSMVVQWLETYQGRLVGLRVTREYRVYLAKKLLDMELGFHRREENSPGSLNSRMVTDTNNLTNNIDKVPPAIVHYGAYLAIGIPLMWSVSPMLTFWAVPVLGTLGLINGIIGTVVQKLYYDKSTAIAKVRDSLLESFQNLRVVKASSAEGFEEKRLAQGANADLLSFNRQEAVVWANYQLLSGIGGFISGSFLIIVGGGMMGFSFGDTLTLSLIAGFVYAGFSGVARQIIEWVKNRAGTRTIRKMMLRRSEDRDDPDAEPLTQVRGHIRVRNLTFAYPKRQPGDPEVNVLDNLSFEVQPGQTAALAGDTGSGKSTIAAILMKLWPLNRGTPMGTVTVDGRDIRKITTESLKRNIAFVPQEPELFEGSLYDNLVYGSEGVSREKLEEVIDSVGARFIHEVGLDSEVKAGGKTFSGGQQALITIIRALLRDPRVLIIDEPTANLDTISENEVFRTIETLRQKRKDLAIIVIAHRLSTIRNADNIIVLGKGRVMESGTHDELLARGGEYSMLWEKGGYGKSSKESVQEEEKEAPLAAADSAPDEKKEEAQVEEHRPGFIERVRDGFHRLQSQWLEYKRGDPVLQPILAKHRREMRIASWAMAASGVLALVKTFLLRDFIDAALRSGGLTASPESLALGLLITALSVVNIILTRQTEILLGGVSWIRAGALRAAVYSEVVQKLQAVVLRNNMAFHMKHASGELVTQVAEASGSLVDKNLHMRVPLAQNVIVGAIGAAAMFWLYPLFSLVTFFGIVAIGVAEGSFEQKFEKIYAAFNKLRAGLGRFTTETFTNIQTIRIFGTEKAESRKFEARAIAVEEAAAKDASPMATTGVLEGAVTNLFVETFPYILGVWAMVWGLVHGVSAGSLYQMVLLAGATKAAVGWLSKTYQEFGSSKGETEDLVQWLGSASDAERQEGQEDLPPRLRGEIRFENVSFEYPPRKGEKAGGGVENISFGVPAGSKVAIVGRKGAGKSTIIDLLLGFHRPSGGTIRLDAHDIAKATPESLRRDIALIPQDAELFTLTIGENIAYPADGPIDQARLDFAVRAARVDEFVYDKTRFPSGLDTPVVAGGRTLSKGQRQRVFLARAIYSNARILLIDEATSGLDKKNEELVKAAIDGLRNLDGTQPTRIIVAHNLPTVEDAEKIVVIDYNKATGKGFVSNVGPHQDLMRRDALYRRLYSAF